MRNATPDNAHQLVRPTMPVTIPSAEVLFSARLIASEQNVRAVLVQMREQLCSNGITDDICGVSEIVLAEALNNIVEHAFAGKGSGMLQVDVLIADGQLRFELSDHGHPMPAHSLPPERLPELGDRLEDLPEGGFGWFMIHRLTSALSYEREDNVNRLTFVVETM